MKNASPGSTRRPRNWEALQALESVSPPSPSPSFGSDFMQTLYSVGEIPIIIDASSLESQAEDLDLLTPNASPARSRVLASISAASTVETVGTFGPRHPVTESATASTISQFNRESTSVDSVNTAYNDAHPANQSAQFLSPQKNVGYYDKRASDASRFTISAYLSPSVQQIQNNNNGISSPSLDHLAWSSPCMPRNNHDSIQSYSIDPSASQPSTSSLSTIMFAAATSSASPSFVTEPSPHIIQRDLSSYKWSTPPKGPNARLGTIDSPAESPTNSPKSSSRTPIRTLPSSPDSLTRTVRMKHRGRMKSTSTTRSNDSAHSKKSSTSGCSDRSVSSGYGPPIFVAKSPSGGSHAVSTLPEGFSWLENIVLQLWIDQEGFRLVRPAFRLAGYSSSSDHSDHTSTALANSLTDGLAEFRPVKTQAFLFHHAPLDPPPALRKMTMADDDTRDYISRQASLSIKTNGVYSVSGTESFDHGSHGSWRFEYRVDSEDVPARGRQAERTLTPLSFACTPMLLHPTRGKKVGVMQVVKKNLTPKLSAARVNIPLPSSSTAPPDAAEGSKPHVAIRTADTHFVKLLHPTHRRVHSTSPGPGGEARSDGIRTGLQKGGTQTASTSTVVVPLLRKSEPQDEGAVAREPVHQLPRHILPPSEIAHLLDEYTAEPSSQDPGDADAGSGGVKPLHLPPLRRN